MTPPSRRVSDGKMLGLLLLGLALGFGIFLLLSAIFGPTGFPAWAVLTVPVIFATFLWIRNHQNNQDDGPLE